MKKYPYLYEIPILYLLLVGINQIFIPELPAFINIDPHPYWIGILLFGFRYGVMAGLASGILSALLYLVSAWFFLERYLFEDLSFYFLPSFFVLVGGLVGMGVHRYQMRLSMLEKERALLSKNKNEMEEEIRTLKEINAGLEKRIVTRMSTLITLYEGARRLESVNLEELYAAGVEFAAKTLQADEVALYLKSGDIWKVKSSFGWKDYQRWPQEIKLNEGITGLAGTREKIVSIRDFLGKQANSMETPGLLGDCILAGPVRKGEKGEVIAVLSVQSIPFLNFNSATINLFGFLLNWISRAVASACYVGELKANEIIDPVYQIYSYRYFQSRSEQEFLRSKTYYLPLSLGLVSVEGLKSLSRPTEVLLLTMLSQIVKQCSREMDVVSVYPELGLPFAVLWITASPDQTREMKEKILDRFAKLDLSDFQKGDRPVALRLGTSSFSPQTKSFDDLLHTALGELKNENQVSAMLDAGRPS